MKKKGVIGFLIVLAGVSIMISGCFSINEKSYARTEKTKMTVIEALNKRDKDALRSVFSQKAIEDAKNYEEGEEYLFSIYGGECESCDKIEEGNESFTDQKGREISVYAIYSVKFQEKEYRLYLYDYPINNRNKEKRGLYSLALLPVEEAEISKEYLSKQAGIYYPGWTD